MSARQTIILFGQLSMTEALRGRLKAIQDNAASAPDSRLAAEDVDALAAEIVEKYDFHLPALDFDRVTFDEPAFQRDSAAATCKAYIPVSGDPTLLMCYDSTRPLPPPRVEIDDTTLIYTFDVSKAEVHLAQKRVAELKKMIETYLPDIRRFADAARERMRETAKQPLLQRRAELEANKKAMEQFKKLGFPIRKRDDEVAQTYFPVKRKVITVPDSPRKVEENPSITMAAYEDILQSIRAMAHGFERSPAVFREMDEEDLRMVLLIGLNAVYEGKATAETFNVGGKTDILIRVGDNNIFIAECFVWDGKKTARSKLDDQLMKYTMWRDTKTALIVFNRTRNLTSVVQRLREEIGGHPQCMKPLEYPSETGFRHLFRRPDDPERHFYLTCLVFDVPSPEEG